MKYIFFFAIVLFARGAVWCQTTTTSTIVGKWMIRKVVATPEITFDLDNRDSTHRQLIRLGKEKNASLGITDSATAETFYQDMMTEMGQMYLEFKPDKTYVSNAINGQHTEKVEKGTYNYIAAQSTLKLSGDVGGSNTGMKASLLNDSTLLIFGVDSAGWAPSLTFRRVK